MFYLNARIIV